MNFVGVMVGGISVAYALVELLPADRASAQRYLRRSTRGLLQNSGSPKPKNRSNPKPPITPSVGTLPSYSLDLVGSTALSTQLDVEDLRDVIALYQRCVEETVRRFDGFIAKFLGDGVLVYFGYPEAHEDDPERAVRAGLELVAAVKGLQTPEPLEARVGIATGLVVVGDAIGSGPSQEQAIVGKTPNLAARLQSIAAPSTVVIADSTRASCLAIFLSLKTWAAKT
jgi:hypothetical protein